MDTEVTQSDTVCYRRACLGDWESLSEFTDTYLSGSGRKRGISGSGKDYFVRRGHHKNLIRKQHVLVALCGNEIIGWAVMTINSVLIHLLVRPDWRKKGIGTQLLKRLSPDVVRNKTDQSTGDPTLWYEKRGYSQPLPVKVGRHSNISLLSENLRVD